MTEFDNVIDLDKETGTKSRKWIVLLVIIGLAAACYLTGAIYFHSHFYSRGSVFGIPMMNQTVDSLKEQIREKVGEYTIEIETRDGVEKLTAKQIGLDYDDQGELEKLLDEQKEFAWVLLFLGPKDDHEIDVKHDDARLSMAVSSLSCLQEQNMTAPTDAFLSYEGSSYVIKEETYGNKLDPDKTEEAIREAINAGENSISLEEHGLYENPEINKDTPELVKECEELNDLTDIVIVYDFGDRQWHVNGAQISEWVVLGDDFTYTLDEDAVKDFVHEMAYHTDTFGLSRKFRTTGGTEISLKGGDYGWCINQSKTTSQLLDLIEAGESVTVEPEYRYSGVCRDSNDIGDTYIEISIAAQTMWVYKDGKRVVSTPVVTGNVSGGHSTPAGGVWAIDARLRDYTLTGQDYNAPVEYWMPFNGNVGIHDSSWRSEYGGDIYKTNGSHGCINTPLSAMKTVYESVKIGYPVVVY